MRRFLRIFIAFFCVFCLCSCQKEADPAAIAAHFASAQAMTARVEMEIDCGSRVYPFSVDWRWSAEGSDVTILAPESVAGVTAHAAPDGLTLTYGDTHLVLADEDGTRSPTPPELLPLAFLQWQEGGGTAAMELLNGLPTVAIRWEETLSGVAIAQCTWFEPERMLPLRTEFSLDGQRTAICTYPLFTLENNKSE